MSRPLAYFLTWTCFGTWLHGDERGSVDDFHNRVGRPILAPDPVRVEIVHGALRTGVFTLDDSGRQIVDQTIREHIRIRAWHLHALNVRTNHVHVVVTCPETLLPERAMEQFKAWCTRRLREAGKAGPEQKVWTEHGSTRWINDHDSLARAIQYVLFEQ